MARARRMMVRFTEEQFKLIEKLAQQESLSSATYVRRAAIIFANRNSHLAEKMREAVQEK